VLGHVHVEKPDGGQEPGDHVAVLVVLVLAEVEKIV